MMINILKIRYGGIQMSKKIGYRGIESPDIIFYISRILHNLSKKVAICDYSPANEMKYYIPMSEELDVEKLCIDYRGVDYTKQAIDEIPQYDVYLINFGFLEFHSEINECDLIVFISDMNRANMKKLCNLPFREQISEKRHLVIRDVLKYGIHIYLNRKEIEKALGISQYYEIPFHNTDMKLKTYLQYNSKFKFQNISSKLYNYVIDTIEEHLEDCYEQQNLKKAVQKAMKGG